MVIYRKEEMATLPDPLIWEMVKKNNSFLVKQFGRGTASVQFSKEPNNLYNLNTYKHSGKIISCVPREKGEIRLFPLLSFGFVCFLNCWICSWCHGLWSHCDGSVLYLVSQTINGRKEDERTSNFEVLFLFD